MAFTRRLEEHDLRRVVYLDPADKCDRPLPHHLPGVNQTVITSQIRVAESGLARFASLWTHLPHAVSRS
jgi:hypothetical protein